MWAALVLLLSFSNGIWVDVPFVRQPKDGCGSASIWMVIEYWRPRTAASIDQIHRTVFRAGAGGVFASEMESYFAAHGFLTQAFTGEWQDFEKHLAGGRPLIVSLESDARGRLLHYVVVAGLDAERNLIFVNDPADRKLRALHRADFESLWKASGNWTLLAIPDKPVSNASSSVAEAKPEVRETPELIRASEAFRREDYSEARRYAERVLRADPSNATAAELLATLYFLSDNTEAAIAYWNRVEKPLIRDVAVDPPVRMDPVRLDRAFAFARGSVLNLNEYRRTVRQLDATGSFSNYKFELRPADGDDFDLTFRSNDRSGAHYVSWLSGLPFQTIRPSFIDIGGRARNIDSEFRWDRQKRKALVSFSGPVGRSGSQRFSVFAGARNERWSVSDSTQSLKRVEAGAGLQFLIGSRGAWKSEIEGIHSKWSSAGSGSSVRYRATADYDLVRIPERRLTINAEIRTEVGRWFSGGRFARTQPSLKLSWFPKQAGSEYSTSVRLSGGAVTSNPYLDESFCLGLDRDGDLLLRAHPATVDGRKGAGVIVSRYALLNAESERTLFRWTLMRFSLAPFLDLARTREWYQDTGVELRVSLASAMRFSFSFGKDLQTGKTAVFARNLR